MRALSRTIALLALAAAVPALAGSGNEQPRQQPGARVAAEGHRAGHAPAPAPPPASAGPSGAPRHGAPPPYRSSYHGHGGAGWYGCWGWGGWGWGGWGWGGWGPWGYRPYDPWGYWGYYPPRVVVAGGARVGAIDTDVSPERAEVWIDGERIGIADDYDGFPDYLYLEPGAHDVAFYLPGYKTLAMQITVRAGVVVDVDNRLERGEAILPTDLGPKTHVQRDIRLQRDREAREEARRAEAAQGDDALDARAEPGRLRVAVEPGDASVYLDGRFLGTGLDLARLRAGLLVDAGEHTLEIVRPGYASETRTLEVAAGEESSLEVTLARAGGEPPVN